MAQKRKAAIFDQIVQPVTIVTSVVYNLALAVGAVVYVTMISSIWFGLALALLAVANELIDMLVQTKTVAKGQSQLPAFVKKWKLEKRPLMAKTVGFFLIIMGAIQNTLRGGTLIFNVLRGQNFVSLTATAIWRSVCVVASVAGIYNLGNFAINFRKLWNKEINNNFEERPIDLLAHEEKSGSSTPINLTQHKETRAQLIKNKSIVLKGGFSKTERCVDHLAKYVNQSKNVVIKELSMQAIGRAAEAKAGSLFFLLYKGMWQLDISRVIDEANTIAELEERLNKMLSFSGVDKKMAFVYIEDFSKTFMNESKCQFRQKAAEIIKEKIKDDSIRIIASVGEKDEEKSMYFDVLKDLKTDKYIDIRDPQAKKNKNKTSLLGKVGAKFKSFYQNALNNHTWLFDKVVGGSMLLSAVLYFVVDLQNLSKIVLRAIARGYGANGLVSKVFGFLFSTTALPFGLMPIAVCHGLFAYLNCMVLWGFNNFNFHASNITGANAQEKAKKLSLTRAFHFGPNTRRLVLYLREFILCAVDIMSALLVAPVFGLPIGISLLVSTMICRWVVFYFQSRQDPIDDLIAKDSIQGKVETGVTRAADFLFANKAHANKPRREAARAALGEETIPMTLSQ